MWGYVMRILLIVCYFHCSFQINWDLKKSSVLPEWEDMAWKEPSVGFMPKAFKSHSLDSNYLYMPEFVRASSATAQKGLMVPQMGERPVPHSLRSIMLPPRILPPPPLFNPLVELLCHIDRMYVRIRRDFFRTLNPWKYLKMGKCLVNQGTKIHYYFLYLLTGDCDFLFESNADILVVKNVIHFLPTTRFLIEMPFDIPVQCNYHRYIHAYKVAVWPKLQGGTLYKLLRKDRPIVLIVQDASGNEKTTPFEMGQPMYFEVKQLPGSMVPVVNERLYINHCSISPHPSPFGPSNAIIDNYGCMVKGVISQESRFLIGQSMNAQRFTIKAEILLEMASRIPSTKKLFMHCEVYVGQHPATQSYKACNYNRNTQTWSELYGDDSVCSCCGSACTPQLRAPRNKITSQGWSVNFNNEDELMESIDDDFDSEN